eukprot:14011544-Alexandrium_andersonii.AAC.1
MGRAVCCRCEQTLLRCRCDWAQPGKASEQRSLLQMWGRGSTQRQLLSVSCFFCWLGFAFECRGGPREHQAAG